MVQMTGKYKHEKNENLDEYFQAIGVPYVPRKMMCSTSPSLEINKSDSDEWTITTSTMFRTQVSKFRLGEEYEETMPGGVLKNVTTLEENKLLTASVGPNDSKIMRSYKFSDTGCVITMKHEASGKEAKRYFKREV